MAEPAHRQLRKPRFHRDDPDFEADMIVDEVRSLVGNLETTVSRMTDLLRELDEAGHEGEGGDAGQGAESGRKADECANGDDGPSRGSG